MDDNKLCRGLDHRCDVLGAARVDLIVQVTRLREIVEPSDGNSKGNCEDEFNVMMAAQMVRDDAALVLQAAQDVHDDAQLVYQAAYETWLNCESP